jgi:hypothetical protein
MAFLTADLRLVLIAGQETLWQVGDLGVQLDISKIQLLPAQLR